MPIRTSMMALTGGLDLVTPPLAMKPGFCSSAENYEASEKGYTRVQGYERFDGQASPTAAVYTLLPYIFGTIEPVIGDVVTGGASGTTGVVLEVVPPTSGVHADGDASGGLVLVDSTGTFQPAEALTVAGVQIAISDGVGTPGGNLSDDEDARLIRVARDARRDRIGLIPGSGPVRGVATYLGDVLAWRDNEAGTSGRMWKATSSGWVQQSFGHVVSFTGASAEFIENGIVTGTNSGAFGNIERVVLTEGAWDGAGGGRLVVSGLAGVFQDGEQITSDDGAAITSGGAFPVRLAPGGKYRTVERNFYASRETTRLYVAYGAGPAFEWDGSTMAPILTGTPLADDRPSHVAVHLGHLALGYTSGSLQISQPGEPLSFRGDLGAAEIGFGTTITGLLSDAKGALFIAGSNRMGYLTGATAADFTLQIITDDSGALPGTLISAGEPVYVDDRGIRRMSATEAYGDWRMGAVSEAVEPLIRARRSAGMLPVGMMRVKQKDQIRLVWADGSGLSVFLGGSKPQPMPFRWDFGVSCLATGEENSGREVLFAGSGDGWVYQIDMGGTFDGGPTRAFFRLAFDAQGSFGQMKRYHGVRMDGVSMGRVSLVGIGAEFGYAGEPPAARTQAVLLGSGGAWDEVEYAPVVWSAPVQDYVWADLDGMGENVGIMVVADPLDDDAHTLTAAAIHYSEKRRAR